MKKIIGSVMVSLMCVSVFAKPVTKTGVTRQLLVEASKAAYVELGQASVFSSDEKSLCASLATYAAQIRAYRVLNSAISNSKPLTLTVADIGISPAKFTELKTALDKCYSN